MRARRFWAALGSLLLVSGLAAPSMAADSSPPPPQTMAALGDSITVAYDATRLLAAQPEYSWSTGYSTSVRSLSQRFGIPRGTSALNLAVSGKKIVDLPAQAADSRLAEGTDLVTILMGANDACTSTVSGMTSEATFRSHLRTALTTLATVKKVDQIALVSIPNVYQLYTVYKDSASARFVWGLYKICQSMLANPTSSKAVDVQRRQAVLDRVKAFNAILADECTKVSVCRYDGGQVFGTAFARTDVSTVDYFHPSIKGQNLLALTVASAFKYPA